MALPDEDSLSDLYEAVPDKLTTPWRKGGVYRADLDLLKDLIGVPVDSGKALHSETGALARAVDVWLATEFRRARIEHDAVFPRSEIPRQLPQAVSRAIRRVKYSRKQGERELQERAVEQVIAGAGGARVNILGGFFVKEIDVVVADWDRGLELAVSSKTMTGSFGNNLKNRFEEATGDLLNIRRRYPMAAFGFVFLVTANILDSEMHWEFLKDMMRKLGTLGGVEGGESYDATCLLLVDWEGGEGVVVDEEEVPEDLSPNQFFAAMVTALFSRSRVVDHKEARELWLKSKPS